MDTRLVAAIAFGLTYYYYKCKKNNTTIQKPQKKRKNRRLWMSNIHKNRTRQFIESKVYELLCEPSGEFSNICGMSFADFDFLLNEISPIISKQDTDFRAAIPAKYRLAITLRFLASGDSYNSLHRLFKVSTPMISKTVREVCQAISEVLKDEIKIPETAEGWLTVEEGFRSTFPHCIGLIDGKHIVVENPCHGGTNFSNYKQGFCILLLTLVDSQYRFIFADIEIKRRIGDHGILNDSQLWEKICKNEIDFPRPCPLPGSDVNVPYVFVADEAFELSTHVMTPYPGTHDVGSSKRLFNQNLSKSRAVVENTFGILTSVFRIFRHPINLHPETVSLISMTCLLLHNFLRKSKNSSSIYTPLGSFDEYDCCGNLKTPGTWRRYDKEYNAVQGLPPIPPKSSANAREIREEFTSHFYRNIENISTYR